jgi:hypothetical protein
VISPQTVTAAAAAVPSEGDSLGLLMAVCLVFWVASATVSAGIGAIMKLAGVCITCRTHNLCVGGDGGQQRRGWRGPSILAAQLPLTIAHTMALKLGPKFNLSCWKFAAGCSSLQQAVVHTLSQSLSMCAADWCACRSAHGNFQQWWWRLDHSRCDGHP